MTGIRVKAEFWGGKRVLVTGHTGFKGGWLALWLGSMGAEVHGFSLPPPTEPNFFTVATVEKSVAGHDIGDICDLKQLLSAIGAAAPEIVLHLAAQPLVRNSYSEPVQTYATNVMGTVHVLEAVRQCPSVRAVVIVTSDKCYENREWIWGYRETEPMGGFDPYSSSKGCAELVTSAYRDSFLASADVAVATARAGNVIGGGDWAADRLIPDFFRATDAGRRLEVRHPYAIRPWQHVLEPLSGYITLAERLFQHGQTHAEAWNFGPADEDARPVCWLIEQLGGAMPGAGWHQPAQDQPHEAAFLKLDSSKAHSRLSWAPQWSLPEALQKTMDWHQAWRTDQDMSEFSISQIVAHQGDASGGRANE